MCCRFSDLLKRDDHIIGRELLIRKSPFCGRSNSCQFLKHRMCVLICPQGNGAGIHDSASGLDGESRTIGVSAMLWILPLMLLIVLVFIAAIRVRGQDKQDVLYPSRAGGYRRQHVRRGHVR